MLGGQAAFCSVCSRLFRRYDGENDDDDAGQPRCEDCAAASRLRSAVSSAAR
jgi:hypothetical protein